MNILSIELIQQPENKIRSETEGNLESNVAASLYSYKPLFRHSQKNPLLSRA